MKTVEVALSSIKPYWRNARDGDAAVEAVAKSIEDYGYNSPIVVDKEHVIVAGHVRHRALLSLGWKKAAVLVVDLPAAKVKEYRIADNKTSELAEWQMPELIEELRELADPGDFQTFFPEIDLSRLLADSVGDAFGTPTDEEVAAAKDKLEGRFAEINARVLGDVVEVTCPHCAGDFSVSRREVLRDTADPVAAT